MSSPMNSALGLEAKVNPPFADRGYCGARTPGSVRTSARAEPKVGPPGGPGAISLPSFSPKTLLVIVPRVYPGRPERPEQPIR